MVQLTQDDALATLEAAANDHAGRDPGWMQQRRAQARERFRAEGVPTPRLEDWKYTDLRAVTRHDYVPAGFEAVGAPASIPAIDGLQAVRLVLVDGRVEPSLSELDQLPDGVEFGSLGQCLADDGERLRPWLGAAMPDAGHGLVALNDAFAVDGAWLQVADGVEVDTPLEIVFVSRADGRSPLVQPRNLVVVGAGARLRLLERYVVVGEDRSLTNAVTEMFLARGAEVEYTRLQEEGERGGHVGGLYVRQQADSRCTLNTVSLDGLLVRNDLRVALVEAGAECRLNGLALGNGRQHIDNHTTVEHVVERCTSRELYKSVLDGRARAVFHGRIVVHPDAQQTDSEQNNHNLLLSADAEIDTKPQLEIYADDVKCAHGATVGQLDEDSVFYLRSRGIDEEDARALLTIAFADAAVAGISIEPLRAHIDQRIRHKLGRTD